jgi:membrane protease YdiL (CAAX protease family)
VNKKKNFLAEAIICSLGLMGFSYFIHHDFPGRFISLASLLLPAYIIGKNLRSLPGIKQITGEYPSFKAGLLFFFTGISGGMILAVLYRWYLEMPFFPQTLCSFVIVAALIGSLEELVFRGFIQEHVRKFNALFSIIFSTIAHTGYKCCLFLSPFVAAGTNLEFLAFWTILAGLIFSTIRHFSKSIIPSLVAHALFDILVYAEYVKAPWWVW